MEDLQKKYRLLIIRKIIKTVVEMITIIVEMIIIIVGITMIIIGIIVYQMKKKIEIELVWSNNIYLEKKYRSYFTKKTKKSTYLINISQVTLL